MGTTPSPWRYDFARDSTLSYPMPCLLLLSCSEVSRMALFRFEVLQPYPASCAQAAPHLFQIPGQLTIYSEEMAILITGCVSCPRERPSPIFSPGDGLFVVRRNKGQTQSERTHDLLPCGADSAA